MRPHDRLFLLIGIFSCMLSTTAPGQYYAQPLERITIEDGLSNNSINSVVQTNDGFLWVATKDGLNRYDGQSFKIFKNDPSDAASLPENYVMTLHEDKFGTLYVGTWGRGLYTFNRATETFVSLAASPYSNTFIQCMYEDSSGRLWYGTTSTGISYIEPSTQRSVSLNDDPHVHAVLNDRNIISLAGDGGHTLWIGTARSGVYEYDMLSHHIRRIGAWSGTPSTSMSSNILYLWYDTPDALWVGADDGYYCYDLRRGSIAYMKNMPADQRQYFRTPISWILRDKKGRQWIGTYEHRGLLSFETNGYGIVMMNHHVNEDDNPLSLVNNRIRCIYEDHKQNLWFGTENGLCKLPTVSPFIQYRHFPVRANSLSGRVVSGICGDKGNGVWVGYGGGGFDHIDLAKSTVTHFHHDPANANSLNNNDVVTVFQDKTGIVWVGTMTNGLNRFDPRSNSFTHYEYGTRSARGIRSNWIQQLLETHDGQLLVGTNDGLQVYHSHTNTFDSFHPLLSAGNCPLPDSASVNALFEDSKQTLWIGTWLDGLYHYDPLQRTMKHYMPEPNNLQSLSAAKITSLYEDSKGFLWIGTHSGGLDKFDRNAGTFRRYTIRNGLPNDVVFGMLEDRSGNLWVSTMKGLAKFDPVTEQFQVYTVADGLVHNQFNWRASYKDDHGMMFFGGLNGFVAFYPDSFITTVAAPQVAITSLKIFEKEAVLPQTISTMKEVMLAHDQNFFSLEFIALDLAPAQKHSYEYMLEGIDLHWVQAGMRTKAYYTDIRPGAYKFLVKARNADGEWSRPVSLALVIKPAWWMTWWFKVIVGLMAIGVGFLIYRYRVNQLLAIERIRYNIASDLHDEIGSNLSSISVDGQMLMRSPLLNDKERQLSTDINKTAMETIDAMRDIVWFINPKHDAGEDIIFKMKETASKLFGEMQWSFTASSGMRIELYDLGVRRNIFLIYKEALTNIARHADATFCSIEISAPGSVLTLAITDNGKGFDVHRVKENNGLLNMRQRAENIHAQLHMTSGTGKGTSVVLTVPL